MDKLVKIDFSPDLQDICMIAISADKLAELGFTSEHKALDKFIFDMEESNDCIDADGINEDSIAAVYNIKKLQDYEQLTSHDMNKLLELKSMHTKDHAFHYKFYEQHNNSYGEKPGPYFNLEQGPAFNYIAFACETRKYFGILLPINKLQSVLEEFYKVIFNVLMPNVQQIPEVKIRYYIINTGLCDIIKLVPNIVNKVLPTNIKNLLEAK